MLPQLGSEVPPGSTFAGSGVESLAMKAPDGHIIIIRHPNTDFDFHGVGGIPEPRPASDLFVPAVRSKAYSAAPGELGFRVEHTPFSPNVAENPFSFAADPGVSADQAQLKETMRRWLIDEAGATELVRDAHRENLGWGPEGKMLFRDPGATEPYAHGTIQTGNPYAFGPTAPPFPRPEIPSAPASGLDSVLMKLLNSKQGVRNELAAKPYEVPEWARPNPAASPTEDRLAKMVGAGISDREVDALAANLHAHIGGPPPSDHNPNRYLLDVNSNGTGLALRRGSDPASSFGSGGLDSPVGSGSALQRVLAAFQKSMEPVSATAPQAVGSHPSWVLSPQDRAAMARFLAKNNWRFPGVG
jgi:hypothetical protein